MSGPMVHGLPARDSFFGVPLYLTQGSLVEQNVRQLAQQLGEDPLGSWGVLGDRERARRGGADATQPGAFFFLFDEPRAAEPDEAGIVTLAVSGSLYKGMFWDDYADLRRRVEDAVADSRVRAILLDIDSPGGSVTGCFALTQYLHSVATGSGKPLWAIANDQATSAAHAIGRACAKFYATPTGLVGSIGARCVHMDQSGYDRRIGLEFTEVASGARKNDMSPHKPLSAEGRATLEALVMNAADVFFAELASYSTLTVEALRALDAEVFVAPAALEAGLIDGVAFREQVLEELRGQLASAPSAGRSTVPAPNATAGEPAGGNTMPKTTTETETETEREATAQAEKVAMARMQKRARLITNACEVAKRPELAGDFIAKGMSVSQVRSKLLAQLAATDVPGVRGNIGDTTAGTQTFAAPVFDTTSIYQRWGNGAALMKPATQPCSRR